MKDCLGSTTLDTIPLGTSAVVTCVSCKNQELRNKLLSMGIVEGTILQVSNIAPLGDPISIVVRGFKLSLRKSEAQGVEVTSLALWKARDSVKPAELAGGATATGATANGTANGGTAIEVRSREKWVVQEFADEPLAALP